MRNISTIYIEKERFEEVTIKIDKCTAPKIEYYIYSPVHRENPYQAASLRVHERKLPTGELEKYSFTDSPSNTWHKSKILSIQCDKLIVTNNCTIDRFKSYSDSAGLIVKNNSTVKLLGGSSTVIVSELNNIKVTLSTPEFQGSTIKNTERLIELAKLILDLHNIGDNISYENFGLYRKIKAIKNYPDLLEIKPARLVVNSKEIVDVTLNIINKVNVNLLEFYSICKNQEDTIFAAIPLEIMGEIGEYIQDGDVNL